MGAKPCRDFVQLCVGFDVVSKFKPAEGGFQVKNIRWPQWFHFTKPAFDGTCITKAPTPGSFDARDPATLRTLIPLDQTNTHSSDAGSAPEWADKCRQGLP